MAKKVLILLLLVSAAGFGCKKKDRLSTNTYDLVIVPSVTSLVIGATATFAVSGRAPAGTFQVDPVWTESSNTGNAHFNTNLGSAVMVFFDEAGLYELTADFQDKTARSQVRVASELPVLTDFYTDQGIPSGASINVFGGLVLAEQTASDAPEGFKYMRASNVTLGDSWWVNLGAGSINLDNYTGGYLKFSIRKSRVLAGTPMTGGTEFLKVEMGRTGFPNSGVGTITAGAWIGFTNTTVAYPEWQDVSILLSRFYSGTGVVNVPFIFSKITAGAAMDIDIDNVRLED